MTPNIYFKLAGYTVVAASLFGTGWAINGWRLGAELQALKATHAEERAADATAAGLDLAAKVKERDALAQRLADIDAEGSAALRKANDETERLRTCVRNGTCGLRIAAHCPPSVATGPGSAKSPGVDIGAAPVLDPALEQNYFALRTNIIGGEAKLTACQTSLAAFTAIP